MSRCRHALRTAVLSVGALALLASHSLAQEASEGELIFGERRRPPKFGLRPVHGYVELLAQQVENSASYKLDFNAKNDSTATILSESIFLGTGGYIMHPNIVDFSATGKFTLEQASVDSSDPQSAAGDEDRQLYEWDVRANILKTSNTPATVYTQRTETLVNQTFGETVRQTTATYGADLSIKSGNNLTNDFRVYRLEQTQSSLLGVEDFTMNQNVFEWQGDWRISEYQHFTGRANYMSTEQSSGFGETLTTDSYTASGAHSIQFGARHNYHLTSSVSTSTTTGFLGSETFNWDEDLRIYHTPNFETFYHYSLNNTTFDSSGDTTDTNTQSVEQQMQNAYAGFRHNLFKSLTTTGRVGQTQVDLGDSGSTTNTFGFVNFAYNKKVPLGHLFSTLNLSHTATDSEERSETLPVRNQPIAFTDFQPIFIRRTDVVPGSFRILGPGGRVLSPISDYRITQFPTFVQIERLPGGDITASQPLLLSYDLEPEPALSTTTNGISISNRYDIREGFFRGLSPYVNYMIQDQTIDGSNTASVIPESIRDLIVGAEYYLWQFYFNAEYEKYDSNLLPFDAMRLKGRWGQNVGMNTRFGVDASYTAVTYGTAEDVFTTPGIGGQPISTAAVDGAQVTTMSAAANLTHQLQRRLFITGTVAWLNIEDDISGQTQGLEETAELRWRNRQFEFYFQLRNSSLETDVQEQTFQLIQIGVRRAF